MTLLTRLHTYRASAGRSPTEDFLSETFAEWLRLAGAAGLLPRVLAELLGLPPAQCLPNGDDGRAVTWTTQHVIGPGFRGSGKRPDIVGQGKGFFLIIENKIGAGFTAYDDADGTASQLELYADYQRRQRRPAGGMVLLTHHTDAPDGWREPVAGWVAVHHWLIRLLPELAARDGAEAAVLHFWTRGLINFLEDMGMSGTRIALSDIIALPAFERLRDGMRSLGGLAQKALKAEAGGYAWQTLRVPHGWTSGAFNEPAFFGAVMTPGGVRVNDVDIVLWCGVHAAPAYELRPHIGGIPELSVGIGVWTGEPPDSPAGAKVRDEWVQRCADCAPNMDWTVEILPYDRDPECSVLLLRTCLSLIELHQQAGDEFWDEPARLFFTAAVRALFEALAPYWEAVLAIVGDAAAVEEEGEEGGEDRAGA